VVIAVSLLLGNIIAQ